MNLLNKDDYEVLRSRLKNKLNELIDILTKYRDLWKLDSFTYIYYLSPNYLFKCHSEIYGEVILKIGKPQEMQNEIKALLLYRGHKLCNIYEYDLANGVFLEEEIKPGMRLRSITNLEKRLEIFCHLVKDLYLQVFDKTSFPTYLDWINRAHNYVKTINHQALKAYMDEALDYVKTLSLTYNRQYLLHGDLHHDNILLSSDGKYKIIDPKGVIGDPIFDLSQFMINENNHQYDDTLKMNFGFMINYLANNLNLPLEVVKKSLFIQAVLSECWNVESGVETDLKLIAFAKRLL